MNRLMSHTLIGQLCNLAEDISFLLQSYCFFLTKRASAIISFIIYSKRG